MRPYLSMDTTSFAIAIMAAGKGTRLKSKRPKVLHEIGGRALLLHVIAAAEKIIPPPDRIFCIIGHESDRVRAAVEHTGVQFVVQAEQRGTGHAMQILKAFFTLNEALLPQHLLVLSGDVPLIRPEPPATPEINSGIYCFESKALFDKLDALDTNNAHGEFYLTDVAAMLVAEGKRVVAVKADSVDEVLGANTMAEMMHLDAAMRLAAAKRLMAAGVTVFRPETCVIDAEVSVGPDTVIEPYVQLLGSTTIGADSRIRSYSVIQNSKLGDNVLVRNGCILDTAEVADNAILGPYAHLRPESRIGEGAHVGNFVETKKITMGKGSKANHLNYLGDTVIGANINIGAGAITCNYDGVHKHLTTIGDGAFVGSDSTLVAPVTIGAGAYVAAGSCITDDVPEGALALGRSRQVTKPGWVTAKKANAEQKKDC